MRSSSSLLNIQYSEELNECQKIKEKKIGNMKQRRTLEEKLVNRKS